MKNSICSLRRETDLALRVYVVMALLLLAGCDGESGGANGQIRTGDPESSGGVGGNEVGGAMDGRVEASTGEGGELDAAFDEPETGSPAKTGGTGGAIFAADGGPSGPHTSIRDGGLGIADGSNGKHDAQVEDGRIVDASYDVNMDSMVSNATDASNSSDASVCVGTLTIGNPPPDNETCLGFGSKSADFQCTGPCPGMTCVAVCKGTCAENPDCEASGTTWYIELDCTCR